MTYEIGHTKDGHPYPIIPDGLDYVGRKPCGCVVAWISLNGSTKREIATFVGDLLRRGYSVERMTTEESRHTLGLGCEHGQRAPKARQSELFVGEP